jgi:spore coat polysaccharide biosynthesis protein SpsF (cytidylyltransferase family)
VTLALWDSPQAHRLAAPPAPPELAFPDLRFDVDRPEHLAELAALVDRAGLHIASPAADVVAAARAASTPGPGLATPGCTAKPGLLHGLPAQAAA